MYLNENIMKEAKFIKKELKDTGISFDEYILLVRSRNLEAIAIAVESINSNLTDILDKLDELK